MKPTLLAQEASNCVYTTPMIRVGVDDRLQRAYADWIATQLRAMPAGRRAILWQHPESSPSAVANSRVIVEACRDAGVVPDRVVCNSTEATELTNPDSPLRVSLRAALGPLYDAWPATRFSNYLCCSCDAIDGGTELAKGAVPELNGWPGVFDAFEFEDQAPSLYGYAGNLRRLNEAYAHSHGLLAWHLATIHACHRTYARAGRMPPSITPWVAPRLCGLLDWYRWASLIRHMLLRCGPTLLWFNGDCNGQRPDQELTDVLTSAEGRTEGGDWIEPLGLRLQDRLPKPTDNYLASFARLSDGTAVAYVSFSGLQPQIKLAVPGTKKTVLVQRERGEFSGWGRVNL